MHKWMHSAAGGMSQRLYPGAAIVRSRARKDHTISLPNFVPVCCRSYAERNLTCHFGRFKSGFRALRLGSAISLEGSERPPSAHLRHRETFRRRRLTILLRTLRRVLGAAAYASGRM